MTDSQIKYLSQDGADPINTIKFLRGRLDIDGTRVRNNGVLGDIIDSQPTVIGTPSGMNPKDAYTKYQNDNKDRQLVFIGANDGMLHAFNGSNMTEVMGYIPSAVYPHLYALTKPDYGQSPLTPHTYHVNGPMRQMDLSNKNDNWFTYLVGSLGQGGKGYYALDASNTETLSKPSAIKWEWNSDSDSEMGYTFGAPLIYNVRISSTEVAAVAILANGYENKFGTGSANTSALYIVNMANGQLIKKIQVPNSDGLSAPSGVDFGQDGILDYVYAGDMNGQLWRFDLTSDNPDNFKVSSEPIFVAKTAGGTAQPITMRPAVKPVNYADGSSAGNLILFGTGKLLTDADRKDITQQTFYGVLDNMADSPVTLTRSNLLEQTVVDTITENRTGYRAKNYRKVSTNKIDLTNKTEIWKGWRLDLPVPSERLATSPLLLEDKLLFGTGIPLSNQKCLPGGKGWIMGLNPMTGSVTQSRYNKDYSFTDVKLDKRTTDDDQVSFSSGKAYASGFEKNGIPTELSYIAAESTIVSSNSNNTGWGSAGHTIALREANSMGIYTGNARDGVSSGTPMSKPGSSGKGSITTGSKGNEDTEKNDLVSPSYGVRVSTTMWREIK